MKHACLALHDSGAAVANTKPLRWLMKLDNLAADRGQVRVANTKPLRWLMKQVGKLRDDGAGGASQIPSLYDG